MDTHEMSENDVKKIAIDTINEFTEDTKLENLNAELNSRLVISDGDEFIQSDESSRDTPLTYFEIWGNLRNLKRGRVNG